ncbi:response regulator transcription factor [Pseudomonas chlororaphis]|uniref:response regulator transcription factor n=1 Tax=Pseudomonas chlororaphis TaxID=587753 RepID=UPI000F57A7BB|nr:response regulator transcription factor [Pseudomonas chlororaphis]AZC50504.1 DNA-binding response regulator, LuxR family [Pseudomonas chlororaphis subsp. piscium]AZC57080.1 DNA-binding response regulator, LuxR family [Pseudomonas chlororaphis subsp. piscium]AZC75713.1 DNA-binding response regulator, LuxR family [Pseudomonas chlororaphis subsp. piscium]MBP5059149.1 response regulator transcription factor [Pseudomonas chlororaphis]MBP5141219.1 response regulator transcription factor [Pseudomo
MFNALVVDDHPFIRASVKMVLAAAGFEVVAEADNGVDAVQLARELKPELILLDISMPLLDGLGVISRVTELRLPSKILVLTALEPAFYAKRCMSAGAHGYISKSDDLKELSRAIKVIMDGYTHFPILASSSVRGIDVDSSEQELVQKLSNRELAVLQQLARGFSNKEIGEAMLLSNKTVSNYKNRLIEKLNVKSLIYLADFAKRNKLV